MLLYQKPGSAATQHDFCLCGMDRCRFCDPEYICRKCGFCPVELGPDDDRNPPCKRVAMDFEDNETLAARTSPLPIDFGDGLPF